MIWPLFEFREPEVAANGLGCGDDADGSVAGDWAMVQSMMPPKMLTRMPLTPWSLEDDGKASVTASSGGAAAHVEEVGGLAAVVLDGVHGGHGEAGAVDEAADVAVELDVGEAVLLRRGLGGVFVGGVVECLDVGVAEEAVVVELELGVDGEELAVGVVVGRPG
jgi:hypothetical protein